jgi:7-cyano-7-deazaguanine reductase
MTDTTLVRELTLLGRNVREATSELETFPTPHGVSRVAFEVEEFTSLCPVTGQPDYGTIRIEYAPRLRCLESKSLKLYLWTFRNEGHFCEQLAATIAAKLFAVLEPHTLRVFVRQNTRGGIQTTAEAQR